MAKILVVDDEADLEVLIKQKFRQKIRQNEYEFIFAINGRHALEQLEVHHDVDVVLSDINMPEMDGLTLLSKLNEKNALLKSVIVSAYGDMDNIRTAMNRGAFDFVTKPVNFSDLEITIDRTVKHVGMIKDTLKAMKENNILKMYVDETVLNFMGSREIGASLFDNETIQGTVAFIDICGFTAISENHPPDEVVGLLNEYFDIMARSIIDENGIVDKFMGDAVLAVFKGDNHLERAINSCLNIKDEISNKPEIEGKMNFKPNVSIGINTGEMISGNIGSSTLRRLDYTVIGDTVNTAARLQSSAKEGQIFIAENSYHIIKDSFNCETIGLLEMKNKKVPLMVYEVMGR
ncbi:adenylate/guanylate cyclase domain-containing protein [Aquiflexum lacus]|uniref:adenylate/guanylate cyclase domain-containing protein n=1 Tax=Aquiflexum lacus TaxID=2483805 RepID=UPI001893B39E|nr:adenylate/guanylate cyclase domain-containing protein [Aquiflexum lacus]